MSDDWLTARQITEVANAISISPFTAYETVCTRANDGLILAQAQKVMFDDRNMGAIELPEEFWWARGQAALTQNWVTGDFETWLAQKHHIRAYGVKFRKADVLSTFGLDAWPPTPALAKLAQKGRPPADWWDDLWVEMARRLYVGDLKPSRQADIEKAMLDWLATNGQERVSESTIRPRVRKLWQAISAEDEK